MGISGHEPATILRCSSDVPPIAYGASMPTSPRVVTVGHAIVDVLTAVPDEVVAGFGLSKGTMTLVDEFRAEAMYETFASTTAVSGGSAANTAVGIAGLGAQVAFLGKVRDDDLGRIFTKDIQAAGVEFAVPMGHRPDAYHQ